MATSNFHNVNASKIFAVEIQESCEYDNLKENLQSDLFALPNSIDARRDDDALRSFPSSEIATLYERKAYRASAYELNLYCTAVIRSGYYEGVNLDYVFEEDIPCFLEGNELERAEKWLIEAKARLCRKMENIFKNYSMPLKVVARFSNGETMYQKA